MSNRDFERNEPEQTNESMAARGDLSIVLDRIAEAAGPRYVTINHVLDALCYRLFGPILVLAGLVILAPVVGDIPGVPTLMGALVCMTAVQVLIGRQSFWLPDILLSRSIAREKLRRSVAWL